MDLKQVIMRLSALGYEEIQDVRKKLMNQVRDILRKKDQDIAFDAVEDKKEKKTYDDKYKDSKLPKFLKSLMDEGKILKEEGHYLEDIFDIQLPLISQLEREYSKKMEKLVKTEMIYTTFLLHVRGIGKLLSAKLIKAFGDCSQYDTVSKLWAHCGQSVINGKAPKRRKGETINYNPDLKTLVWIISDCLMKSNKGFYREIYNTEKEKQLNREYPIGELEGKYGKPYEKDEINLRKGHAHNRALRKMRKIFLDHFWFASRELAGLPAEKNYVEGVLNHNHIITWRKALERENELLKE
ncbi:hypothetical protein LCGC14_2742470 [marine sediment metagenome]|uniref:Uncharacterized protein n=1 Tax=marine sediment metagenome TaxID=412755 RepID=A0A0F8Z443_9ZZZZ